MLVLLQNSTQSTRNLYGAATGPVEAQQRNTPYALDVVTPQALAAPAAQDWVMDPRLLFRILRLPDMASSFPASSLATLPPADTEGCPIHLP